MKRRIQGYAGQDKVKVEGTFHFRPFRTLANVRHLDKSIELTVAWDHSLERMDFPGNILTAGAMIDDEPTSACAGSVRATVC